MQIGALIVNIGKARPRRPTPLTRQMSAVQRTKPTIGGGVFFRGRRPNGFDAGTNELEKYLCGRRTRGGLAPHAGFQPVGSGLFYDSVGPHRIP